MSSPITNLYKKSNDYLLQHHNLTIGSCIRLYGISGGTLIMCIMLYPQKSFNYFVHNLSDFLFDYIDKFFVKHTDVSFRYIVGWGFTFYYATNPDECLNMFIRINTLDMLKTKIFSNIDKLKTEDKEIIKIICGILLTQT